MVSQRGRGEEIELSTVRRVDHTHLWREWPASNTCTHTCVCSYIVVNCLSCCQWFTIFTTGITSPDYVCVCSCTFGTYFWSFMHHIHTVHAITTYPIDHAWQGFIQRVGSTRISHHCGDSPLLEFLSVYIENRTKSTRTCLISPSWRTSNWFNPCSAYVY